MNSVNQRPATFTRHHAGSHTAGAPVPMPPLQRAAGGPTLTVPVAMPPMSFAATQAHAFSRASRAAAMPASMPALSRPAESNRAIAVYVAADESSSMGGTKRDAMIRAAQNCEIELAAVEASRFRVAAAGFDFRATGLVSEFP